MIDKLLRRIAQRNAPDALAHTVSRLATLSNASSLASSSGLHDPFRIGYPLRASSRQARTGQTAPGASNPWHMAVDAYIQRREGGAGIPDQPAFFAEWGAAHLAVAQLLWAEHDRLHMGWVHIYSADRLLAVVLPRKRKILLQTSAYGGHTEPLVWKQMGTSTPTSAPSHAGFTTQHLHSLLWFYGQAYSGAPDLLPQQMGSSLLQLRRFPHIEPAALDMRHLALIHVFSAGALSFAQLQRQVAAHYADSLCADIASLYFTGALHLLDSEPLPPPSAATSP
jgi:hypothetical protein